MTPAELGVWLRDHAFTGRTDEGIGIEVEMLPLRAGGKIARLQGEDGTLALLRKHGMPLGWEERLSAKGAPVFTVPGSGTFTFEPGGQLEFGTEPQNTATGALDILDAIIPPLEASACAGGVQLTHVGIDPAGTPEDTGLQIDADRYARMDAHFARIGPYGARMMRQTAAHQVNLDLGREPLRRWRLLNAMAPYAVAIFANSPRYGGTATGHKSYRAHVWRNLDPSRTGVFSDGTTDEYLAFALSAEVIQSEGSTPFAELVADGMATEKSWEEHLTTLFPEVRPKGYLEVRSMDAVPPWAYPAPAALLAGIVYDGISTNAAEAILGAPDEDLLVRGGREGLADAAIAGVSARLAELALEGCARLGGDFIADRHVDRARRFFERYTFAGRCPADDWMGS